MSVAQIAATTDVLLITAFTSNAFALSATKLQALLEAGVGIIYEDYTRMSRVSHLVQTTPTTGGGAEIINPNNKPEITEFTQGITNQFLTTPLPYREWRLNVLPLRKDRHNCGADVFCDVGAGMIIGHDNNQVGVFGFPALAGIRQICSPIRSSFLALTQATTDSRTGNLFSRTEVLSCLGLRSGGNTSFQAVAACCLL